MSLHVLSTIGAIVAFFVLLYAVSYGSRRKFVVALLVFAVLLSAALLSACARTPERYIESARITYLSSDSSYVCLDYKWANDDLMNGLVHGCWNAHQIASSPR